MTFHYEMTHVSLDDESTAMLVREDRYFITLVNEDGFEWTDPADKWAHIDSEPFNRGDETFLFERTAEEEEYYDPMGYNSDSYINYLNGH